jgi:hypothetical protein
MIMEISYLIDCKRVLVPGANDSPHWDYFVSALNDSERVRTVFSAISATSKHWLILPEYQYSESELPKEGILPHLSSGDEADVIMHAFANFLSQMHENAKLCIDVTGMMRPHILFLMFFLRKKNVRCFDMIYTEPRHYSRKQDTAFASEDVFEVRQVVGFEGAHPSNPSSDVLIVGLGYDHHLISHVIESRPGARILQLHSLPSLSADMYQESLLRLERVSSSFASLPEAGQVYCSANDPFVVSAVLAENVTRLERGGLTNSLYLSPLATKPQVIGFGLYYIKRKSTIPASMIFPYSSRYERETSTGVGRSWIYPISF